MDNEINNKPESQNIDEFIEMDNEINNKPESQNIDNGKKFGNNFKQQKLKIILIFLRINSLILIRIKEYKNDVKFYRKFN